MLKVKKQLSLLIAIAVVFALVLAGCGDKGGSPDTEETTAAGDVQKTDGSDSGEGKLKPYDILWYSIGTPAKDLDMVFRELSKYTKIKINATVKMVQFDWGQYNERMPVIIQSGEYFDICFTCSWSNNYFQQAEKGAYVELDKYFDTYLKGTKEVLHPGFLEGTKVNGHNYAVPANKELAMQSVWRFNKEYIDKYKFDISQVRSLESLEPMLKTIKEKEPGIYPISADKNFKPYLPFDHIVDDKLPFGLKLDTTDYKILNKLEQPETMQILETMHKYYKEGYLRKDVATVQTGDDEKTGKWFVGKCDTQPLADLLWTRSLGYEVVSTPMHDAIINNISVPGSMQAISVTSKDPERAAMFLNLVNTDKYVRNMIDNGIENIHYKLSDGRMELTDAHKSYDMPSFSLGNLYLLLLYKDDPANKWDEFKKFNDSAKNAPTLGFIFKQEPVKNEWAALNSVAEEFASPLYTGSVDPKVYVPKAIAKFKAAGLDKVMTEMQRQVDQWRASKK